MKTAEAPPAKKKVARRIRIPKNAALVRFFLHPAGKTLLTVLAALLLTGFGVFIHFYKQYSKLIDSRLRGGPYTTTSRILAAPESIGVGDAVTPVAIANALRRAGYSENRKDPIGDIELVGQGRTSGSILVQQPQG